MHVRRAQGLLLCTLVGCWSEPTGPVDYREVAIDELEILAPGIGFSAVRDVATDGDVLWVLDGAPPFLTRLSVPEETTRQFGDEGQGPGELMNPRAVVADSQGVRVWDLGNRRVNAVSRDGVTMASERMSDAASSQIRASIRNVSYADPFRVRRWDGGLVFSHFPQPVDRTADMAGGSLRWGSQGLEPAAEIFAFSDHVHGASSSLREWASLPLWDVCGASAVVWSPAEARLLWMDAQGQVVARAEVSLEPVDITVSDVEAYLRWMGRLELGPGYEAADIDYSRLAAQNMDRFARTAPLATDLRCESEDVAWIRLFDTSNDPLGRGRTWLRVERGGALAGLRFPQEFTPFVFGATGVVGVLTTADGQQQLARWVAANRTAQRRSRRYSPEEGVTDA